jgi:hypothetical protein
VITGIFYPDEHYPNPTRQPIYKPLLLSALLLSVAGCSTIPTTSQLVLMAEGHNTRSVDTTPNTLLPNNINCNNVESKKIDYKEIIKIAGSEAIKQQTGLTPDEIKLAANLLNSGQFRSDIRGIVVLAILTIPNLAQTMPQSGVAILNEIKALKSKTQPENIRNCMETVLRQKPCLDLKSLNNLLQRLYDDPSAKLERDTLIALLKNKSFRLALIVYAHSNGVDINDEDLSFVQNQLENTDIDLQLLMNEGEKRLKEKYNIEDVKVKMDALTASCK